MKLIYTHENGFLVNNVKNIIDGHHIETILKNEFSSGAIGEVSATDAWVELWIIKDEDFDIAQRIILDIKSRADLPDWQCEACKEENDASFEICWKCQVEHVVP